MRTPKKRHSLVAVLALVLTALPAAAAISPAHAVEQCQHFAGPTPSAEIDLQNDDDPEVRVPSLSNVSVCASGNVLVRGEPLRVEPCGNWDGRCWRILATPEAGATISSGVRVCRAIDGAYSCSTVDQPPWDIDTPPSDTLCIGIDLDGGRPCANGTALIAFE
ncbi:MAG TPA: hypothetical protein VHN37_11270 [Actinomycetota bacterium]|nr:hypothetical protein [Actinomycetota bacterium]